MDIKVLIDHRTEPRCFREGESIIFCGYFGVDKNCGVVFYDSEGKDPVEVRFPEKAGTGRLYSVRIDGVPADHCRYRLLEGKKEIPDPFAFSVYGISEMDSEGKPEDIYGEVIEIPEVDPLERTYRSRLRSKTALEDDLIYLLHVRGFTMHSSSGVPRAHRGTFLGVIDKIDHIRSLGVTAVELMPAYELIAREETEPEQLPAVAEQSAAPMERINYWGYKGGFYLAPRSAYASVDARQDFHDMVDELHRNDIAVIMQFWFPKDYPAALMSMVLRHWVKFYGIDGFHLIGGGLCVEPIACDPALSSVRIYYEDVDPSRLPVKDMSKKGSRLVAIYKDEFEMSVRRFLKADDHSIGAFFGSMIKNSAEVGYVNYLASYDGMRLYDSVSYEHRHNEANRENNADGASDNATWNCGVEGKSRKHSVLKLRRKQIFNALTMLFFAQGTPMIFAGDEFLQTQDGNNNPYCQDNDISWVNWRGETSAMGAAALEYVRFLVKYRRAHRMLSQPKPLKLMDYKAFGYPDLSVHGQEAWQPDFSGFSHCVGMLFCNLYAKEQDPAFIYIAFNCHWESRRFALPAVPKPLTWTLVIDTSRTGLETEEKKLGDEKTILLAPRSVTVLEARGRFKMENTDGRTPY